MKNFAYYITNNSASVGLKLELSSSQLCSLQQCLLSIYEDVYKVCNKYGLCLMLTGGSILGAVRHKGFIPWDDDMDLLMPRGDYDKLIEVLPKELGDKYYFSVPRMDQPARSLFLKIYKKGTKVVAWPSLREEGLHLDVFPLEYAPNNSLSRSLKACVSSILRTISLCSIRDVLKDKRMKEAMSLHIGSFIYHKIYCLVGFIFSFKRQKFWFDLYDKYISMHKATSYMAIPTGKHGYKGELFPKGYYLPPVKAEFEGIPLLLPNKYHDLMSNLYGDYMQIPPVEKREHHFYTEFDLGDEYNSVIRTVL